MNLVITVQAEQPGDDEFEKVEVKQTKAFENIDLSKLDTHGRVQFSRQLEGLIERATVEIQKQRQAQAEDAARIAAEEEDKKREAAKPKRAKK